MAPLPSRGCALALSLLLGGCSYTFDGEQPGLPLVGPMPNTPGLAKLNHGPAGLVSIVYGADRVPWAAFSETLYPPAAPPQKEHRLVRLADPPAEMVIPSTRHFAATATTLYFFDHPSVTGPHVPGDDTTTVSLQSPGAAAPDAVFVLPGTNDTVVTDGYDTHFVWFSPAMPGTSPAYSKSFVIQARSGVQRTLPIPDGADPTAPRLHASYQFQTAGSLLIVSGPDGHLMVHATEANQDFDLGIRPNTYYYDDVTRLVVTCGMDGVRAVAFIDGAEQVLDPDPCDSKRYIGSWKKGVFYGSASGEIRYVPFSGGTPMVLLPAGLNMLGTGPNDQIVYSTDPPDRYINGASDAWLGSWRFMERGLDAGFSRDWKKVRWLEHAAQDSGVGLLMVADVPGGAATPLARNVRQWNTLRDGRVLAASNHAFRGEQNRVVLIDEQAGIQQWVAAAASEYAGIPSSSDLLIDVVSGPSTYDIVRVPLPPKTTPTP